ncbi:GGDEF domain-containing response regulator [Deferrisoma palaeochoriense]
MTAPGRFVILGPSGEAKALAQGLRAKGREAEVHEGLDGFTASLLKERPGAVVLWWDFPAEVRDLAAQFVSHHYVCGECPVIAVMPDEAEAPTPGWIPVPAPPDPDAVIAAAEQARSQGRAGPQTIPRVLVVDDDQSVVLLGSHVVTSLGMIPLVAFDGREAVEKVERFHPDLVLLDINMPDMDGFQVIEALKADPRTALIPIIVFSARTEDTDKVRALKLGADDYVTKPFSIPELAARVDRLLRRTQAGLSASSTTGLPGSVTIEQVIGERIGRGEPLAVLYADADHFKAFNDRYGFARGDGVIRQIADILLEAVRDLGGPNDFVGHVGGDDFVVVTTPASADAIAQRIVERFDRVIPLYYDPEDRQRGYIETKDRRGRVTRLPLMSVSVAVVSTDVRHFSHVGEVADVAAQLKRYAKSKAGSVWVKDQRADGKGG